MVGAYSGFGEEEGLCFPILDVHIPSTFLYRYEVLIDTMFCGVCRFDHEVVVAIIEK
jgi:D-arabinose 1-dehydrogenase-like Zn-dependent alcohol dehydrogenase